MRWSERICPDDFRRYGTFLFDYYTHILLTGSDGHPEIIQIHIFYGYICWHRLLCLSIDSA